ncbi:MAG: cysteine hydrolase family protein [Pseudomonadota bacterium]
MTTALLLIDIQVGFDDPWWGARNNPNAEVQAGRLLDAFRTDGRPVFHVRHLSNTGSPLQEGGSGTAIKPEVAPAPGEPVFDKRVNSAFIDTGLQDRLREASVTDLVIAGLTTPHCVSTSARMAANLGFGVTVVEDACADFARGADATFHPAAPALTPEASHFAALAHLHGEFATVASSSTVLSALAGRQHG